MKITKRILRPFTKCLLTLFILSSATSFADQAIPVSNALPTTTANSRPPMIIPPSPTLDAKAYVLMDANSGAILAHKNMNERIAPASLTKLMTLYVTSQALAQGQIHLNDKVRVSKEAWSRGGSRMFLKENSTVTVQELIDGIIVASGNDACVALAEYVAGNEQTFAQIMNKTAQQLGMKDSHFVDSTGLPNTDHYTTAYDLAILTRALIDNFPQYYGWYKQKWITYNNIKQPNRNRLLWRDLSVDGLKTGHTEAAGYCLISSALRKNMRLIAVVMGAHTDGLRTSDSQALLSWGFRYYHTYKFFGATAPVTKVRVYLAKQREVALGLTQDLFVTLPSNQYDATKVTIKIEPKLHAPIIKDQTYGQIDVTLDNQMIATAPLIALKGDPEAGLFSRGIDHILLFFKSIF